MISSGSKIGRDGRNATRSFPQSFLTSCATRIGERLAAASEDVGRAAAASDSSGILVPVLAARADAVRDVVAVQFPELTSVAAAANNREGWTAGRVAADWAVLHGRDELGPG